MYNAAKLEVLLRKKYGEVKHQNGHNGLELVVKCPVCGKRKLNVNPKKGIYKCWHGCMSGMVYNMFDEVQLAKIEAETASKREAPKDLGFQPPGELVSLMELPAEHPATTYLRDRGFDPLVLDKVYGMRYCRIGRKYMQGRFDTSNTIVIPFYFNGVAVGWQSRLLYNPDDLPDDVCEVLGFERDAKGKFERPPKYFTMPGIDKGKLLWNFDWARQGDLVVVCEGIFDAMAVGRCAVATFGKSVTDAQIALFKSYWKLVVLLLDPGDAEPDMIRITRALRAGGAYPVYVMLKGYKDAGEAPRMEIWRQIDEAVRNDKQLAQAGITLDRFKFLV